MKNIAVILGSLSCIAIVLAVFVFRSSPAGESIACNQDAKMCPDGSYVGRTGPACQFAACPQETTPPSTIGISPIATTTTKLGQKIIIGNITITPRTIVEDSRCPIDVQCIQAGTIRVNVALEGNNNQETALLTLGRPVTFMNKNIELVEVSPPTSSNHPVTQSAYRFTFRVTENLNANKGILRGSMTIGPLCPVETVDNPCLPSPEMYAERKVFVYTKDKKTLITTLTPDREGKFSVTLLAGDYFVDILHTGGPGFISGAPSTVTIKKDIPVDIHISIDTGIR